MPVGQRWVYSGQEQGQTLGLRITVLNRTESLYPGQDKVSTRVVEELEWEDADADDIVNEDGIVTHEGAWRADDPGNAPGIFMPADPAVGMTFQQESAPGVAEDEATIVRTGSTVRVPAGTFSDAITVRDFNPLDGSRGTKMYTPDVGLVRDGPLDLVRYSAPLSS